MRKRCPTDKSPLTLLKSKEGNVILSLSLFIVGRFSSKGFLVNLATIRFTILVFLDKNVCVNASGNSFVG